MEVKDIKISFTTAFDSRIENETMKQSAEAMCQRLLSLEDSRFDKNLAKELKLKIDYESR
jgi:hypothetical protein